MIRVSARFLFQNKCGVRLRSTSTILDNPKFTTVDTEEVVKHGNLASGWWNENGEMKALHSMNKLRIQFIRDGLINSQVVKTEYIDTPRPLQGLKILDVGCGGGILCEPLARIGADVTGIDAGSAVIDVARAHATADPEICSNINYICGTIEEHSSSNKETYDAVIASEVLEHVTHKDLFIESCSTVLKPGGSVFITSINRTMPAWVAGIIAAEYFLHIVPENTHDWEKFATPQEINYQFEKYDCYTRLIHGMFYNFLCNEWYWTPNTAINYALHAVKKK